MKKWMLGLAALTLAVSAQGQVAYTTGSYTQNFDGLANTGTTNTWTNNTTILGWHSTAASYRGDDGSGTSGALYSFGSTSSTERALGSIGSGSYSGPFGVQFVNNNSFSLTSFTLSYDGEQWRRGSNSPQRAESLTFSYQVFGAGLGSINAASGWTTVTALDFTSPNASLTTASALDGNASGNRTAGITSTVNSISWGAGQELWVRWVDANDAGTDHGMAIDNVSFSAIPEPSTYAMLAAGVVVLVLLRRRRACAKV